MSLESLAPEALKQIIYISRETPGFGASVLQDVLRTSRAWNAQNGLTGVMLLHDGRFLQCLEGLPAVVDATMARIRRDPRHSEVEVLADNAIKARTYPAWPMDYQPIDAATWEQLIRARWPGLGHPHTHHSEGTQALSAIFEQRVHQETAPRATGTKKPWLASEQTLLGLAGGLALLLLWALFGQAFS